MRKSQVKGQQVSLNSYFQKPGPSPLPSSDHSQSSNPFSSYVNSSGVNPRSNESPDLQVKNNYLKRSSTEVDQNPAVAKKQRVLPKTVLLSTAPPPSNSYSTNPTPTRRSSSPAYRSEYEYRDSYKAKRDSSNDIEDCAAKLEKLTQTYQLSSSQKTALEAIMQRKSVFYTGAAGTGKSYILQVLLDVVEFLGLSSKVAITAPTGVAACNIRGLTIHSWSGIGLGSENLETLYGMIAKNRYASQRWKDTEILIIDEISMLSAELFDKLDFIGRRVRGKLVPFGGIQLILCGDFFQLPPIGVGKNTSFCFESDAWKELFGSQDINTRDGLMTSSLQSAKPSGSVILLDKVFRQKDDPTFLNVLNSLRQGQVTPQINQILARKVHESLLLKRQEEEEDEIRAMMRDSGANSSNIVSQTRIRPTKLFSTNNDVDSYNLKELQSLQIEDKTVQFNAIDDGRDPYLSQLRAGTKAPQMLMLKLGAQVMLLKNLETEAGLVNGTRGTVIGFEKSNGKSNYFPMLPVVKFQIIIAGERTEETVTLNEHTWDVKLGDKVLASRVQIPLMLAWAISIHKSQGMTIPYLEVSFNRIFEYGQAYVALSRATSLEGLILTGFSANSVRAHPKVIAFYNFLKLSKESARNQRNLAQDEEVLVVALKDLITQFQSLQPITVNHDEWLESRNKPSIRDSRNSNVIDDDFITIAEDEWLEQKRVPLKSLPPSISNQMNPAKSDGIAARESSSTGKRENVIFTEYKPPKPATFPQLVDLSMVDIIEPTQSTTTTSTSQYLASPLTVPPTTIYGETNKNNNTSIQSLNIDEELKRKIEMNRQNALKKLAQLRKRQQEEMDNILSHYSV